MFTVTCASLSPCTLLQGTAIYWEGGHEVLGEVCGPGGGQQVRLVSACHGPQLRVHTSAWGV